MSGVGGGEDIDDEGLERRLQLLVGSGLITGYAGQPTAYGFGFRAHLRSLAG